MSSGSFDRRSSGSTLSFFRWTRPPYEGGSYQPLTSRTCSFSYHPYLRTIGERLNVVRPVNRDLCHLALLFLSPSWTTATPSLRWTKPKPVEPFLTPSYHPSWMKHLNSSASGKDSPSTWRECPPFFVWEPRPWALTEVNVIPAASRYKPPQLHAEGHNLKLPTELHHLQKKRWDPEVLLGGIFWSKMRMQCKPKLTVQIWCPTEKPANLKNFQSHKWAVTSPWLPIKQSFVVFYTQSL